MLSLNLINHLLLQNPDVCHDLSGYNGLVVAIKVGSLNVVGRVDADGLLQPTHRQADTTLVVHHDAVPKIFQGKTPDLSDLAVEGDMQLGWGILMRCARLKYAPQWYLRQLLGEEATKNIAQKAAKIGQVLQIIGQTLLFQAASFSPQHTEKLSAQLNECTEALQHIQNQLDKTNRRMDDLERQMKMYDID